jgi:uncharacterized protein YegL
MTMPFAPIVRSRPLPWISAHRPSRPGSAVVYSSHDGSVLEPGPATVPWRLPFTGLRIRQRGVTFVHEVDTGDQRRLVEMRTMPLPSNDHRFHFDSSIDVGFRVFDAQEVVRRNLRDGLTVVYGHLVNRLRIITKRYDIEESERAEAAVNRSFAQGIDLPEGLTIFHCAARLSPDAAARDHFGRHREAERNALVAEIEHRAEEVAAHHTNAVKRIAAEGEIKRRHSLLTSDGRPIDPYDLVLMHLADQREDAEPPVELLLKIWESAIARENDRDQRSLQMLQYLIDREIIQPTDIEHLRDQLTARAHDSAASVRPKAPYVAGWEQPSVMRHSDLEPVPDAPPPADENTEEPVSGTLPLHTWPIYLLVDESVVPEKAIRQLNEELAVLCAGLREAPPAGANVRLSVMGYAGTPRLRTHLWDPCGAEVPSLDLRPRTGTALGAALSELTAQLADDVRRLIRTGQPVARPLVILLAGGTPEPDVDWTGRRVKPAGLDLAAYAPHVVAFGLQDCPPDMVTALGTGPGCSYTAGPGVGAAEAIYSFVEFLRTTITMSAEVPGTDGPVLRVTPPNGFISLAG